MPGPTGMTGIGCSFSVGGGDTWNMGCCLGELTANGHGSNNANGNAPRPGDNEGMLVYRTNVSGGNSHAAAGVSLGVSNLGSSDFINFIANECYTCMGNHSGSLTVSYSCNR